MNPQRIFYLFQQLKCLARVANMSLIHENNLEGFEAHLFTYYYKAVDTSDGIIQLYKKGLPECAQALFRILFETWLKHDEFLRLGNDVGEDSALDIAKDSMLLAGYKRANIQKVEDDAYIKSEIEGIKKKYNKNDIENMKKYGFSKMSIANLSEKQGKISFYDCLYRNFSRNIHAEDTQEYYYKIYKMDIEDHVKERDGLAIRQSFVILMQMIGAMNLRFDLKLNKKLEMLIGDFESIES